MFMARNILPYFVVAIFAHMLCSFLYNVYKVLKTLTALVSPAMRPALLYIVFMGIWLLALRGPLIFDNGDTDQSKSIEVYMCRRDVIGAKYEYSTQLLQAVLSSQLRLLHHVYPQPQFPECVEFNRKIQSMSRIDNCMTWGFVPYVPPAPAPANQWNHTSTHCPPMDQWTVELALNFIRNVLSGLIRKYVDSRAMDVVSNDIQYVMEYVTIMTIAITDLTNLLLFGVTLNK